MSVPKQPRYSPSPLAILLAATAAAMTAVDAVIVRMLAGEVHPFVIAFFRSLFGFLTILPWIVWKPSVLKTSYRLRHASRAALKLLSLACGFAAFASAPLADVMTIMFTAPVFVMLGAWLLLGEKLTLPRIVSISCCFIGAVIILGPAGGGGVLTALLLAVLAAATQASVQLMLKRMSDKDSVETLVVWNLIVTVPIAAIPAWIFWTTPSYHSLSLLVFQGVLGAANMSLMTKAFSLAPASQVAPVDFLRLPFVALLAFLVFGEVAKFSTWLGAVLIFVALLAPIVIGSRVCRR